MFTTEVIDSNETKKHFSMASMFDQQILSERLLAPANISTAQIVSSHDAPIIILANTKELTTSRVLALSMLRNYFKLRKPAGNIALSYSNLNFDYYLALIDPSMPKLTSCGRYYRMRYVVYIHAKPRKGITIRGLETESTEDNWRSRSKSLAQQTITTSTELKADEQLLLQLGELHLYVKVGEENDHKVDPKNSNKITLFYENISFFLNQTPLIADQIEQTGLIDSNLNQIALGFRRILKQLDEDQRVADAQTRSSLLLEQIKYPRSLANFRNVDHVAEKFMRNQQNMLMKLGGENKSSVSKTMLASDKQASGLGEPFEAQTFVLQMKHFITSNH